jgi:hypothetical protein
MVASAVLLLARSNSEALKSLADFCADITLRMENRNDDLRLCTMLNGGAEP